MEIIKYMIDDLLLIVPSSIKQKVIKEICKLDSFFSFKIIDEIQLKQLVCFDYSINAINYIAKNYNINHSIAKEYIESMYYFDNVTYKSNRLNILNKIKQELIDNDLLSFSPSFKNIIKDKKVIVYGFDNVSKELTFFLNKLEKDYQVISETYKEVNHTLYAFETLEEEVDALCYQISVLLHNGVDINKIKVANYNNDYLFTMKRYFKMYNIAINLNEQTPLFSYYCIKEFYNDYLNNKSIEESLKTFNPYGKCVWDFERDGNVDHQTVIIKFENGATGSFNMIGGSVKSERNIHIVGTLGEIKGTFEDSKYVIRRIAPFTSKGYVEELVDVKDLGDDKIGANGGHGGGDKIIVHDFIDYVQGDKEPSFRCTTLEDSKISHLTVFKAEEARKSEKVVKIDC